jgi:hypothetical protein
MGSRNISRSSGADTTLSRMYLFVDEAGNLDFSPKGSRYFILTSVAIGDCSIEKEVLQLRRELVWNGHDINDAFHASADRQVVRDEVFKVIGPHRLRVDATVFEKAKARPHLRDVDKYYERAWYLHMKHLAPQVAIDHDEMLVVGASFGTLKKQRALTTEIQGVIRQVWKGGNAMTVCWPAATDPCLQVADYCCWAIQRKWELGDKRSHVLIESIIATEYDIFAMSEVRFY